MPGRDFAASPGRKIFRHYAINLSAAAFNRRAHGLQVIRRSISRIFEQIFAWHATFLRQTQLFDESQGHFLHSARERSHLRGGFSD